MPYGTYFPVLNDVGECVYLLYYIENLLDRKNASKTKGNTLLDYNLGLIENLDFSLVENMDMYIFSELEEYTHAIAQVLIEKYPSKQIYFLDEKIFYFPDLKDKVNYVESIFEVKGVTRNQCLWVTSDAKIYFGEPPKFYTDMGRIPEANFLLKNRKKEPSDFFFNTYNSMNVLYSMCWCSVKECFGRKNKDCTIFLVDCSNGIAGLGDYIKFVYTWYLVAKCHKWKFAIDLCRKPNQYLMSDSENMWDYFFEPMSDMPLEEVYESASVIRMSSNKINLGERMLPYFRHAQIEAEGEAVQFIKFNKNTKIKIDELMPKILKKNNYVLGVILRGTDYRPEANKIANRFQFTADLNKMVKKCKFIMDLYGYQYLFLATEDLEYYERMKKEFGDKCLSIDQKRVYYDYCLRYKWCAELLCLEDGREFGRKYLAIIQSLANCKALLSNIYNNTTWMAEALNDSQYEYFEVVTP